MVYRGGGIRHTSATGSVFCRPAQHGEVACVALANRLAKSWAQFLARRERIRWRNSWPVTEQFFRSKKLLTGAASLREREWLTWCFCSELPGGLTEVGRIRAHVRSLFWAVQSLLFARANGHSRRTYDVHSRRGCRLCCLSWTESHVQRRSE